MNNIDILKPQCRLDDLWVRVITKNDVDLPLPQSRLELYVTALITGNIDNLPYPQSRVEMLLYCILTDTEYTFNAQSRVEMFLKAIITLDIEGLPTPMSRLEWYLDYIVRNGCLEKYEYYPFNIWSYLNVKNTPKARMKFKNMKGNTLVNIAKTVRGSIVNNQDFNRLFPMNFSRIVPGGTTLTYVIRLSNAKGNARFKLVNVLEDGTESYPSGPILNNISNTTIIYTRTISQSIRTGSLYFDKITEGDPASCDIEVVVLEGDHTRNPPDIFEGMKSFGESENKIEVLSTGSNILDDSPYKGIEFKPGIDARCEFAPIELFGDNICLSLFDDKLNKVNSHNVALDFTDKNKFKLGFFAFGNNDNSNVLSLKSKGIDYSKVEYVRLFTNNQVHNFTVGGLMINHSDTPITEYKQFNANNKSTPMYRNTNGELVPVPVLRGKWEGDRFLWGDEILLHEDGKLYYHKRCEVEPLNFDGEWILQSSASGYIRAGISLKKCDGIDLHLICDKLKVDSIAQANRPVECIMIGTDKSIHLTLSTSKATTLQDFKAYLKTLGAYILYVSNKEEVYPCELSEQLYSYDGETNIFINGGAVVGETVIEVGTKLGPIVATLKQETLRNARAVEGLLAHGVQEMAYQLYPEDFNKDNTVEMKPIEWVE